MRTASASVMTRRAPLSPAGMFRLRTRSQPVPEGTTPSVASGLMIRRSSKKPLAISFIVPSPPTPMTSSAPSLMASRAMSVACWGFSVNSNLNSRTKCLKPSRISPQRLRVRPRFDSGLTMTLVVRRIGGSRRGRRRGCRGGRRRNGGEALLPEQGYADDAAQRAHDGEHGRRNEQAQQEPSRGNAARAPVEDPFEAGGHLAAELGGLVEQPPGQSHIERPQRDGDDGVDDGGHDAGQGADDGPVARFEQARRGRGQELGGDGGAADDPEAADAVAGADERQPRKEAGDRPGDQSGPKVFGSLRVHGASLTAGAYSIFSGRRFQVPEMPAAPAASEGSRRRR